MILNVQIKKIKWTPKNQKFENLSATHKFYFDLGPNRYLGPRDPIIESIVQGMDPYPVNKCTYILQMYINC